MSSAGIDRRRIVQNFKARLIDGSILIVATALLVLAARLAAGS